MAIAHDRTFAQAVTAVADIAASVLGCASLATRIKATTVSETTQALLDLDLRRYGSMGTFRPYSGDPEWVSLGMSRGMAPPVTHKDWEAWTRCRMSPHDDFLENRTFRRDRGG